MKNRIELTIEHKDHNTVELTNDKGDTFTYNPQKHEGLEDFLSGAKILPIADVRVSDLDVDALAKVIVKQKVLVKGKEFLQTEEKHILHKSSRDIANAVIEYLHSL